MADKKQVIITYAVINGKISMSVEDFYKLIRLVNQVSPDSLSAKKVDVPVEQNIKSKKEKK